MLGLAEVVLALAELGQRPAEGVLADLAELPQQVVAAKLLRGKGGDIMRAAYCRCIPALYHVGPPGVLPCGTQSTQRHVGCWHSGLSAQRQGCMHMRTVGVALPAVAEVGGMMCARTLVCMPPTLCHRVCLAMGKIDGSVMSMSSCACPSQYCGAQGLGSACNSPQPQT